MRLILVVVAVRIANVVNGALVVKVAGTAIHCPLFVMVLFLKVTLQTVFLIIRGPSFMTH